MDTCVRGFSFMSESKPELQYIESGELEKTWRSTRRERMKQREQMIWDNFVKEQDAVKGICKDDPYQFLDPLPESCMKEIMENEQPKLTHEDFEEEARVKEHAQHGTGDNTSGEDPQHTCVVTFADDIDRNDCDMFHIFDDDQSDKMPFSGPEDEVLNDCSSPETVRERPSESADASAEQSPDRYMDLKKSSSKSSENVASVIESSIYCARVKELRAKINEELLALMTSLDRRDILLSSESEDIARMVKRSAEFCNRFNRIYMYQLQRQIHDIKRNSSHSLPFAKHTQFQSQMTRIVALHQNILQSFMVFHKSFTQTCCVRESAGALGALLGVLRDATHMCLHVAPPKDFTACLDLYKDDLVSTCDKVDEFVNEYAIRCEEFLNRFESKNSVTSKKIKKEMKVKKRPWNNRSPVKSGTESQLSMYSMDTVRLNFNAKSNTSSKDNKVGSSSKMRIGPGTNINLKRAPGDKIPEAPKSTRRSRRPLMRDPHAGRPRAPMPLRENDIQTMVEAVGTCASSHISYEDSPRPPRGSKRSTPRNVLPPLPQLESETPSPPPELPAPPAPAAQAARRASPSPPASPAPRAPHAPVARPAPHPHPAPRTTRYGMPARGSPRPLNRPATLRKTQPSPRPSKLSEEHSPSKKKPGYSSPKSADALKESLSFTRYDETDEQQVMPVLTIKCAMKKNLKAGEGKQDMVRVELAPRNTSPSAGRKELNEKKKAPTDAGECSKIDGSPRDSTWNSILSSNKHLSRSPVRERNQMSNGSLDRYEVTKLLKQLCSGDGSGRTERVTGAKNAQLVHMSGSSPRQPSTPQLLRILEETIKKKIPKPLFQKPAAARSPDRYRLQFNVGEKTADTLFQYRTKFVQHMLTSSMYANSAVGKPWEMIGNISEQIIDEVLLSCVSKMELREIIQELYNNETC